MVASDEITAHPPTRGNLCVTKVLGDAGQGGQHPPCYLFVCWMDILDTDTQRYTFEELTTYLSSTFYLQVESQEQMCRARKTIEAQHIWRAGSTYTGEPARADENMKEIYCTTFVLRPGAGGDARHYRPVDSTSF